MEKETGDRFQSNKTDLENNRILDAILSTRHLLIAYMDRAFNFISVNCAYAEADNREPGFFIGKNHFELYPDEENQLIFEKVIRMGEAHTSFAKPFEYADHPERGVTYWDWTLSPVKDVSGNVDGIVLTIVDVTQHKLAEIKVTHKKEEWEQLFDALPDLVAIIDDKHRMVMVNKAMADKMGIEKDAAVGLTCYEEIHGASSAPSSCPHSCRLHDGCAHSVEIYEERLGSDYLVTVVPIDLSDGRPGSIHIARDIGKEKKARRALRESEKRLKTAGKIAYDLIYEWNVGSDELVWFGDINKVLGYGPGEIPNTVEAWVSLIRPEDLQMMHDAVEIHRTSTEQIHYTYRIKHKTGNWQYWEDNALPLLDNRGKPYKWVGVCTDITARKRAEIELKKSEERLNSIFEASPNPIVFYDKTGLPLNLNPAFVRTFGWSLEDIGNSHIPFVPVDEKEKTILKIEELISTGKPVKLETRRFTRGGDILDTLVSAASVKNEFGDHHGTVVNLTDITARKRLEKQLQQAKKMESIATLAGGICHDFNNILAGIIGLTQLTMDQIEKGTDIHQNLEMIFREEIRAADLVKQILMFSTHLDTVKEPVHLKSIINTAVEAVQLSPKLSSLIKFRTDLEDIRDVMADPNQINGLVMNLLTNAVHAMEENGGVLSVSLRECDLPADIMNSFPGLEQGDFVKMTVADTGCGIPAGIIDKIFDPYFTTKDKYSGTGLSLAVAQGTINRIGGAITVESAPEKGTVFDVYLPVSQDKEDHL